MSETMALREQIKEILTELGFYKTQGRFVLSCTMDHDNDTEQWIVGFRIIPVDGGVVRQDIPIGVGDCAEVAYQDMLRSCALLVSRRGLQAIYYDGDKL
ncbi:MAG: RNase P/MRP, p29 subunit [Aureobasidium pullulans]|nr:MAG: RNase P/MRP, p29 subunit [Aureobasidium pullulans]